MDRRTRQAQTTADRYFYKFISCYVEAKHNEIYKEALALLKRARAENPGVKDLVKTATYMRNVHPEMAIPRYYLNRNLKQHQQQQPNLDNFKRMMLFIPLTSVKTKRSSTSAVLPSPETATSTPQSAEAVQLPETATSTPQSAEAVQLPETATSTQPPPQPAEDIQLPLPTEIYEGLLKELQTDPELANILNNFPFDSMDASVNDSVNVLDTETSPLEQVQTDPELANILNNLPFDNTLDSEMVFWQDETSPLEREVQAMLDKTQ